jgi:glycine betaine/proline transport system ATP-binding protein
MSGNCSALTPSGFLAAHDGQPETDAITKAGLVGAVRRVDLDVREGEIFVIMGLVGIRQVDAWSG